MKKLLFLSLLLFPVSLKALPVKYVQISTNTPSTLQAGTTAGFYVSSGTSLVLNATTMTITGPLIFGGADAYISSATAGLTNLPASGAFADLLAITPTTTGTYDCSGVASFIRNGATLTDSYTLGFKTTPGNSAPADPGGTAYVFVSTGASQLTTSLSGVFPRFHVSLTGGSTVYFKFNGTYTGGPPQSRGFMDCERVR